ncbi:MAG: PilX N-terminal domain-containing pilus assembly protein [Desulfobulbales bacterium]
MKTLRNEEGFVLVTGLLILLVLTLLGISATRNTSIELQIAGNDRVHNETFYSAEAGAILGSEILEQNFNCGIGFAKTGSIGVINYADIGYSRIWDRGNEIALWRNPSPIDPDLPQNLLQDPNTLNRADVSYPVSNLDPAGDAYDDQRETGYLYIGGFTEMLPGGALQMAAGYEGKGKGSAVGGVAKIVDIYSRYRGVLNSETVLLFGWRHVIGSEGDCIY